MSISRDAAANLVSRVCEHLDDENWAAFLALCAPTFRYRITVRGPEVQREMVWFDQDHAGLEAMFKVTPEHLRRLGTLFRHVAIGRIESQTSDKAVVYSTVHCSHTDMEGRSKLLAVGRYVDTVLETKDGLILADRETRLKTRDLGVGSHVPI